MFTGQKKRVIGIPTVHVAKSGRQMMAIRSISPGSDKLSPEQHARNRYGPKKD